MEYVSTIIDRLAGAVGHSRLRPEAFQRAGARLQMLVIDEDFGSQDEIGRRKLVEAVNRVQGDFACILVITHINALKDVFPTRIEIAQPPQGSVAQVV